MNPHAPTAPPRHPMMAVQPGASVLIIEDSDALRRGLQALIEETGLFEHIYTADNGLTGYKLLRQHEVDVVLCDLQMPGCDGFGFLRLKQSDPRSMHVPTLMLTAADCVATRVKLLNAGACDYVPKPAHPDELRARLTVHLRLKQLHDELRQKTEELDQLAHTDTLTGVANRRHLDEVITREYDRALRYKRSMSVLMIDLDHFKALNDTHGHLAGDHALEQVALILKQQVRKPDVVARYGGEEFMVVMPETPPKHALIAAERIRREIERADIRWEGTPLTVTASIGVAGCPSMDVAGPTDLLERADSALYSAKKAGRNRVNHAAGFTVLHAHASATGPVVAHN